MLASTRCDNMIYAPILTSAATFALMSAASPAALACLTASPAASHCLTRASMMLLRRVGGVKQDVLLQPKLLLSGDAVFALADKSSCSERH